MLSSRCRPKEEEVFEKYKQLYDLYHGADRTYGFPPGPVNPPSGSTPPQSSGPPPAPPGTGPLQYDGRYPGGPSPRKRRYELRYRIPLIFPKYCAS